METKIKLKLRHLQLKIWVNKPITKKIKTNVLTENMRIVCKYGHVSQMNKETSHACFQYNK